MSKFVIIVILHLETFNSNNHQFMGKVYIRPNCSVLEVHLAEAINLGVGSGGVGEQDQYSKKNVFEDDFNMDESEENVKWDD